MLNTENLRLNLLICSLNTLLPNDETFKINFQVGFGEYNYAGIFLNRKHRNKIQNLLNKSSLRTFVYTLLEPVVGEKSCFEKSYIIAISKFDKKRLLKKYLKKFRRNYIRCFSSTNANPNTFLTNKEINAAAIKALLFIYGSQSAGIKF
jgi:hypothetical protein